MDKDIKSDGILDEGDIESDTILPDAIIDMSVEEANEIKGKELEDEIQAAEELCDIEIDAELLLAEEPSGNQEVAIPVDEVADEDLPQDEVVCEDMTEEILPPNNIINTEPTDQNNLDESEIKSDNTSDESESTIFTKKIHQDKPPKKGISKLIRNVIAAILAVCVLAGAVYAITIIFPSLNIGEGTSSEDLLKIQALKVDKNKVKNITVTNKNDSLKAYYEYVPEYDDTAKAEISTKVWRLEGIDGNLTAPDSVATIVANCTDIVATKKLTDTTKDYGFNNPNVVCQIQAENESENYSIKIGNQSPDKSGHYVSISSDTENVYIVADITSFEKSKTDYGRNDAVDKIVKNEGTSAYFEADSLIAFDFAEIGGTNFPDKIRFEKNPYNDLEISFVMVKPFNRNVKESGLDELIGLASTGITASGTFSFTSTAEELKTFGLDSPYATLSIKIGTYLMDIALGKEIGGFYPVKVAGKSMIFKVPVSSLAFAEAADSTYYSTYLIMDDITTISAMEFYSSSGDFMFELGHGETANDLKVTYGGNAVSTTALRNLYKHVIKLTPQEYTSVPSDGEQQIIIKLFYNDAARSEKVITIKEYSERRSHISINGIAQCMVPYSYISNIIKYSAEVAQGKEIPDPLAVGTTSSEETFN